MTDHERQLDLEMGDLQRENARLTRQLHAAMTEALELRHKLEHIYATALLALEPKVHDDHASY